MVDHPLVQHKLTLLRDRNASTRTFRALLSEISILLAYEVTRDMPVVRRSVTTPLAETEGVVLDGKKIVLVSILRAGNGLVDGMLQILPSARVGHIGLYRDPDTHIAIEYYFKVPTDMAGRDVIVADPMLATGHSAIAAVERVAETEPRSIKFVCLLAARQGVETFHQAHPDVPIYTAAVDEELDDDGFIRPGVGDAGDRLFGTQ